MSVDARDNSKIYNDNMMQVSLNDFVGQQKFVDTMKVSINASKMRGEILPHILLVGPRGSGKNTLARAIAEELGSQIRIISFSALRMPSDLEPILAQVHQGDVILIENFDSIKQSQADILTPAMDSFALDIVIGRGAAAKNIHLDLPQFTLIATMDSEKKIPAKIRGSFSFYWYMEDYSIDELKELAKRFAILSDVIITQEAIDKVSTYSKGSYRNLTNVMKKARDFALVKGDGIINMEILSQVLI